MSDSHIFPWGPHCSCWSQYGERGHTAGPLVRLGVSSKGELWIRSLVPPNRLDLLAGLRFPTASCCVPDLWTATGAARAVGPVVGGADRGVCEPPAPGELLLREVAMRGARCELASASGWPAPVLCGLQPNAGPNRPSLAWDLVGSRCSRNKRRFVLHRGYTLG